MRQHIHSLIGSVVCVALFTGCGCADVALNQVTPNQQTLRVGESVTLTYETGGACMVNNRATDVDLHSVPTVWHTADTLVVAVDSLTGRVTGRAPGAAWVVSGGGSGARIQVQ
jgi:hypothetical protein